MLKNKNNGFILITMMLFLTILTIVVLTDLDKSLLNYKMSQSDYNHTKLFQYAKTSVLKAIQDIKNSNIKISDTDEVRDLEKKDLNWWNQHAKRYNLNENVLHYIVQNIEELPCVYFVDKSLQGARFYRITARASDKNNLYTVLLQATYAMPVSLGKECNGMQIFLHSGIQGWRIIQKE